MVQVGHKHYTIFVMNLMYMARTAEKTLLQRIPPLLNDVLSGLLPSDSLGIADIKTCLPAVA
jgi:uncharacterized membrane protein